MPLLTVFTPAYNRAHTLPRTYESLCRQDCKDFIWLIIDDGSTDNTSELVKEWMSKDNGFEIRYIYKENGGMHTAHNVAYEHIDTELNTCIDSDDKLTEGAAGKIVRKWSEVKNSGVAGIVALDADFDNHVLGKKFDDGLVRTTLHGYYRNGGSGDKKLIYRTDIVNEFPPYPVFEGEKFVALSYKYRLIDEKYELAVMNEIVCNVEYQPDGSSNSIIKQIYNNPQGYVFWRKYKMEHADSVKQLFSDSVHYVSSSITANNRHIIKDSPKKAMTIMAFPFGIVLSKYIRHKAKT